MDEKTGVLGSFLAKGLKSNQLEVNTDEKTLRPIARLKEPRDLFALPKDKDNVCSQQAPRWPVECQVIEERIVHIPYVPTTPEPLSQPTGNEIKPRPVGEENGTVVFNYNPISAVNYDKFARSKKPLESSDSDDSDIESDVGSMPESKTIPPILLKSDGTFTKLLDSLSSSNDDDEGDGDECDVDSDAENVRRSRKRTTGASKLNDIENNIKNVDDEIEDIWADKTPEYAPSTPTSIRSQFGKTLWTNENKKEESASTELPKSIALNNNLSRKNSISNVNNELKAKSVDLKNIDNVSKLVSSLYAKEHKDNTQSKENAQTYSKTNNSTVNPTNDNEQTADDSLNLPQFSRSSVGGSKILTNCHPYNAGEYDGLEFESRFESGNLAKAVQITPTYYELYLRPDLYTSRSKQWFYFRVRKTKKNVIYRFSIVNLVKSDSLYNDGMRPVMYSTIDAKQSKIGWRRCGENVCYYQNEEKTNMFFLHFCSNPNDEEEFNSYTLTFNIQFEHDNDTVYFAHSYPYTYSDLQDYLMEIQKDPVKSKFCKLRLLCRSLAGNNVYYLTVTAPTPDELTLRRKKSIVVSARVHPSETPASWMMKGLMDFITGDTNVAKRLRHKFIFKLIPMLNPDGVIVGNTRNSLTGKDLNRQYRTVIREYYPSIWYTKALIKRSVARGIRKYKLVGKEKRLVDECGVTMYCDMHAHSRRHNIFIYGCENKRVPEKKLTEQVFPLMMHKNVADKFSFESCKFKVQRSKEGTGRIVVWMLGITNSYTIEASFGGTSLGSRKGTHFNTGDYEHMGRAFCETLLDYYDENPNKVKIQTKLLKQIKKLRKKEKLERKLTKINKMAEQERLRLKIIERLLQEGSSAEEPLNIPLSDYSSDEGTSSSSDNEGKSSLCLSDLEGPCCAPVKAPPTSPVDYLEKRRLKLRRMRRVMHVLDRIYFQPILKRKLSLLEPQKKKPKPKKYKKIIKRSAKTEHSNEKKDVAHTKPAAQKTNSNKKVGNNSKKGTVKEYWKPKKHKVIKRKLRLWLAKHRIMIYRINKKKRTKTRIVSNRKKDDQIRIPLDMPTTDPGTDVHLTDEEFFIDKTIQNSVTVPRPKRFPAHYDSHGRTNQDDNSDSAKQMPPELIVTSPAKKTNEMNIIELKMPQSNNKSTELPLIGLPDRRTSPFTNIQTNPKQLLKTRIQSPFETYAQQERNKDLEFKLSLKKKIWTGASHENIDNKHALQWGLLKPKVSLKKTNTTQTKPQCKNDTEALLNGCSKKLLEIQQTSHVAVKQKSSKLTFDLSSPRAEPTNALELDDELPSCSKSQKSSSKSDINLAKSKRKSKANISKFASATQIIKRLSKNKSAASIITMPQRPAANSAASPAATKTRMQVNKFKTGGIVATAIQPSSKKSKKVRSSISAANATQQAAVGPSSVSQHRISKLRPIHAAVEATEFVHKVKKKFKQTKKN